VCATFSTRAVARMLSPYGLSGPDSSSCSLGELGTTTAQTVAFDLARNGGTLASVSHDALAAFAHSHPAFPQPTNTVGLATNAAAAGIDAGAAQNLALIGQYAASSFAAAGDSHGAPMISDPSSAPQLTLAQPHA
jgi:hypothetical protein